MNNTGFNLFSFMNNKTKEIHNIRVGYNCDWSSVKTGNKDLDSIFAKADLNGDGIAQANELSALNKLFLFADSQFNKTANNGILEKNELNFLQKLFKNKDTLIQDVLAQQQKNETPISKPWSEGLNRHIKTISISRTSYKYIDNFSTIEQELIDIGKKEGFTVRKDDYGKEPWAEDAKINRADGKTYLQYYNSFDLDSQPDAVESIAKTRRGFNIRHGKVAKSGSSFNVDVNSSDRHIGTSYLEGGNVLLTLKADGVPGAVVGDMSVAYTMSVMNLENNEENVKKAKAAIAEDLGIEVENLTVIPQYEFHIDMCYRPLNDGEMAIPDYDEGIKVLTDLINDPSTSKTDKQMYSKKLEDLKEKMADPKMIELRKGAEKSLTDAGYKLVKIPDFGEFDINYMNGVGGTSNVDGEKFYITNKSGDSKLDRAVEQYYKNAGISRVYFVSSKGALDKLGGIDCLTNASMD